MRIIMSIISIFLPWLALLIYDNPGGAVVALIMQATLIGWPFASAWALRTGKEHDVENKKKKQSKTAYDTTKLGLLMSTRVIVNGAQGKMGTLACETLQQHPQFELVASLNRDDNLAQTIVNTGADIVVDLTRADCVYENSLLIIEAGARPVIGTSGLLPPQIDTLRSLCDTQHLGALIVPNFSLGAVLMMMCAEKIAAYFPEVEIIEAHHQQKLDAPSGTALKTAELIAASRLHQKNNLDLKELVPGVRGGIKEEINIHSIRLPGILARQEVLFGSQGETLSITHNSIDRHCFMPGIILACQKVLSLNGLVYGLEHVL